MFSDRSASGKRAMAPDWWNKVTSKLPKFSLPFLRPKEWNKKLAEKWANSIPNRCPFERQIWFKNVLVLYIPPLCSLNPISKQLYSISIEAKTYLYDLKKHGKM